MTFCILIAHDKYKAQQIIIVELICYDRTMYNVLVDFLRYQIIYKVEH
jgi:hypothetical protein